MAPGDLNDDGETYVVAVVLEGDAADVVAALHAFDRDADDPVAALRAAFDERAAAAASDLAAGGDVSSPGTSFESNFDDMQAANELTYDDDVDVDQDVSAAQNMGT